MIYLCKFLLVISNHLLLHVPKNCFQDHSTIFPGTEVRMTSLQFLGLSFLICLKMDMTFVSLQSLVTFLDLHCFSKMMEKGSSLATIRSVHQQVASVPLSASHLVLWTGMGQGFSTELWLDPLPLLVISILFQSYVSSQRPERCCQWRMGQWITALSASAVTI